MSREAEWIVQAIEAVGKTAEKDGEYWRASYTEQDRKATALLRQYMEEAGMETYVDAVGNLFGRIGGKDSRVLLTGSHRDTVRNGGKYDGMLGVLTALKAAGDLKAEWGVPEKTVEIVAFCEEESSRFPTSYLGSRNVTGSLTPEELEDLDENGISLREAMKKSGYLKGEIGVPRTDLERFTELHIEQGGVLEKDGIQIGIVTSIVGLFTGEVYVRGQQNHAGTTPMYMRRDPVPVAAEFICLLNRWAMDHQQDLVCTVGRIDVEPGNANVIPEQVMFTFDIRSSSEELLAESREKIARLKEQLNGEQEITVKITCDEPPVHLDPEGRERLKEAAEEEKLTYKEMVSGAGHDSQAIGQKYKTNMIFVPSKDGVSHSPREYTFPEDIGAGYAVLKNYLKKTAWQKD